jgi:F0F1-type ATP synthase membrane subunit a
MNFKLTDSLPLTMGRFQSLVYFEAYGNYMEGEIPVSICEMPVIEQIFLGMSLSLVLTAFRILSVCYHQLLTTLGYPARSLRASEIWLKHWQVTYKPNSISRHRLMFPITTSLAIFQTPLAS